MIVWFLVKDKGKKKFSISKIFTSNHFMNIKQSWAAMKKQIDFLPVLIVRIEFQYLYVISIADIFIFATIII